MCIRDRHLSSLKKLGVTIREDGGYLDCTAPKGLYAAQITLPFPSVGATENIMIAASMAQGETVIQNAAREPEILDLAGFLNACGAKVRILPDGKMCIRDSPKGLQGQTAGGLWLSGQTRPKQTSVDDTGGVRKGRPCREDSG